MQKITFRKQVSRGSRFNQIYIPKSVEKEIGVGDEVEVTLVKKHTNLYFSKGLHISPFKKTLIADIFAFLSRFKEISQVFVVGSFLVEKVEYRDIDIVAIVAKPKKEVEELLYKQLINRFNMKFHVLAIPKERFTSLLKSCPLTRAMFAQYISNQEFAVPLNTVVDKKHLQFLLMMPEDVLSVTVGSRVFFDNIRRLVTIQRFLEGKNLTIEEINKKVLQVLGKSIYGQLKGEEPVDEKTLHKVREVIRKLLVQIKRLMNGKKE